MPSCLRVVAASRTQRENQPLCSFATVACILLSLFAIQPARAQVLFGSVVGSVTDLSGAGVPGAVVKITEMRTNESRSGVTNETGTYTISTVPAGTYQVEIAKSG